MPLPLPSSLPNCFSLNCSLLPPPLAPTPRLKPKRRSHATARSNGNRQEGWQHLMRLRAPSAAPAARRTAARQLPRRPVLLPPSPLRAPPRLAPPAGSSTWAGNWHWHVGRPQQEGRQWQSIPAVAQPPPTCLQVSVQPQLPQETGQQALHRSHVCRARCQRWLGGALGRCRAGRCRRLWLQGRRGRLRQRALAAAPCALLPGRLPSIGCAWAGRLALALAAALLCCHCHGLSRRCRLLSL